MVLNEEKRNRLAEVIARRQGALDGAGSSAPSSPFAAIQALPTPAPLEKNKGVVAIDSDENTGEGIVFKRQRVVMAATSHSATDGRPPSFRDHPSAPPLLAHSSHSKTVGRTLLRMTKCPLHLSFPLSSNTLSRASKRKRQRRL